MANGNGPKRKVDRLFQQYGASHRHPVNKGLHWIGIPVIVWSALALLWAAPVPGVFSGVPYLNWATIAVLMALFYYFRLSVGLAVGMLVCCLVCFVLIVAYQSAAPWPLWQAALAAFVAGWVLQIIGHGIEGRKPSLLSDLRFLLIGPAWLLHILYRRLGMPY